MEELKMGDVAKDLTAGTIGGASQLICGHPFDTIKVKLQSQPVPLPGQAPKFSGAIDAVKQTVAKEGTGGLFKGMGAPLATVAALNAILFTARGQMEAILRSEPGSLLTINQQIICGAGAGIAVAFPACPTELIKCRLQAQSAMAEAGSAGLAVKYTGPIDVARHVYQTAGARGLFRGLVPTLAREIPGNAAMFGVYEGLKQYLAGGLDTSKLGRGSLMLAGGLAGGSFWIFVYPTDVVKSAIQVDDFKNPKYSGSIDAFRKILAAEGVKGLYKGFTPAMARSVPANAACFLAYEMARSSLGLMNTMEDHHQLPSHSFMPLLSRVDRLDSVMKDVEKKKHGEFSVWSNGRRLFSRRNSRQGMPLTVATKEVGAKGSLMNRIRSLEDRLLQLSQEIDQASSKASSSSSIQSTSLWTTSSSSCAQSKSELPVTSYPTFHLQESKLQCHEYFQRDLRAPRQRMKNPENNFPQPRKLGKDITKEKACFNGMNKKKPPCWPRMKLLGC